MKKNSQIVIVDLGCQYTQLIARVLLSLKINSLVLGKPGDIRKYLKENTPKGIILSGSNFSVYADNAPEIPEEIFSAGCPILGICYGMQYIAYREDNSLVVSTHSNKEYGPATVFFDQPSSPLFAGINDGKYLKAWESHGDSVRSIPKGFVRIAESARAIAGIQNLKKNIFGIQFHPEVVQTEDNDLILKNFVFGICKCKEDWDFENIVEKILHDAREITSRNKKIGIGVSGGVDSTTLAKILSPLGDKLFAFFIDTGGMRLGEVEEVRDSCKKAGIKLHVIRAKGNFFKGMSGVIDAEKKRKAFKKVYQRVFHDVIKKNNIGYIAQGTLATDLIESGKSGNATMIKSHHNTGLKFSIPEFTPFKGLFKHQVREIARNLGLSDVISERKPFPGPGLFIRVVDVSITDYLVKKLRVADDIVNNVLKKDIELYKNISQIVVGIAGVKTVGVQGSERTYNYPCVVRTVFSTDFMTVDGAFLPKHIMEEIISEVTKHGFNRVWFDYTPKPPGTTEFQ